MEKLVEKYVDQAIEQIRSSNLMRTPNPRLPREMVDLSIPRMDDWIGWKPVPSTVTDNDLDEIEKQIGLRLPHLYRIFLKYLHFIDLTEIGLRFPEHPIHDWQSKLEDLYNSWEPERILGEGLIPFASETFMDAGPVCFDTRKRLPDGDCPIVYWDHDWVGTSDEITPIFSSSLKMFQCLTIAASASTNFVYHDEDDSPNQLSYKKTVMLQFLEADPHGAGGSARNHWTSWGVDPDEK